MTTATQTFAWEFGGWLGRQPPQLAWSILVAAAVAGMVLVIWSYRSALASIAPVRQAVLASLRVLVWWGLLVILAGPTRVERVVQTNPARPLAVLVDRSGSMSTTDNRQRRRIDDALLRWRDLEPAARRVAGGLKLFAFADGVKSIASAEIAPAALPAEQTTLFAAMLQVMKDAPTGGWGGLVTLTDGLDTTAVAASEGIEAVSRAALATNTPLIFVPGRNRYSGGAFFTLREFLAPAQTPPRTTFRVEATFDAYQTESKEVGMQLTVNGVARRPESLRLEAGRRLATWSTDVQAEGPGVLELELRVGNEIARRAVTVAVPPTNRILYFQGALDWGYRFFSDIMKRDAAFVVTPVFNFPNPTALLPPGALGRMPATTAELASYDIVVLANAAASQFSVEQQQALSEWVREGGILLFLTPDDDSTQGFAGSEMEKMLPVVFQKPEGGGGDGRGWMAQLVRRTRPGTGGSSDTPVLTPYAWEDTPRVREIFAEVAKGGGPTSTPVFAAFAHVARAKPGAEVLARHPDAVVPGTNEHAILLAIQRYGRGQSTVLTTDALWRWKLNQPSTTRGAELFWQNLFAWLGRDRARGMTFDRAPLHAPLGREMTLRIERGGNDKLNVRATLGNERVELSEGSADGARRVFQWTPRKPGFWQITATNPLGHEARHWLQVDETTVTAEFSGMAPNEDLMRLLAARTGGTVLEKDAPPEWNEARGGAELVAERRQPLWHRGWLFGTLLGLYAVELLLRRKWHLL